MARTTKKNAVYFAGCNTLEDLTGRLMSLIIEHGADDAKVIEISAEYDTLYSAVMKEVNKDKENWQKVKDNPEELRKVAMTLLTYKDAEKDLDFRRDCVLELRGRWYWVFARAGKDPAITKQYKELLNKKGLGFRFKDKTKEWYWFSGIEKAKRHRVPNGAMTPDEIRQRHGSKIIEADTDVA